MPGQISVRAASLWGWDVGCAAGMTAGAAVFLELAAGVKDAPSGLEDRFVRLLDEGDDTVRLGAKAWRASCSHWR